MVIFLMPTSIYVYESDEEKSIVNLCYKGKPNLLKVFKTLLCYLPRSVHFDCCGFDPFHFLGLFKIC